MILYLMRHADAGTLRGNPLLDFPNGAWSAEEGKEQCMLMARALTRGEIDLPDTQVLR